MSSLYTYSNRYLSLWQSAAAKVQRGTPATQNRRALIATPVATRAADTANVHLMAPVDLLGEQLAAGQTDAVKKMFAPPSVAKPLDLAASAEAVLPVIEDCVKVAAEFLWAEITGNSQQSATLAGELKDSECDIGWGECLTSYLLFKASAAAPAYRPNMNPVFELDANTRIGIIGDWGTGDDVAINVLQQVASFKPDVLLHLGDVYYSGTQDEEQNNFLNICRSVLGSSVRLFSLCGNHDMYSGGNAYYGMVDQIGQQASYFCLQNANWRFLAMDTGHNDNDPFTVGTNMTSLVTMDGWAEENWHLDKINTAGSRNIVLLSHHQLFSPFASVGQADGGLNYAYNKNLRASFQAVMSKVVLWFWGHEHTQAAFDPYMGLQRGRCVGASAIPVFTNQQSYKYASGLQTYGGIPLPTWNAASQLATNGNVYNNGFAIMTLNGASATVNYYQVPILKPFVPMAVSDSI